MAIISLNTNTTGLIGDQVEPRRVTMVTTDNLATITAAGYMNSAASEGFSLLPTDIMDVQYSYNINTGAATFGMFEVSISVGVITLSQWVNSGDVLLPVVDGHFANFNGTSGQIEDAGYSPSNASKTKVCMANGAVTSSYFAVFTDTAGTITAGGNPAINPGLIQSGVSGTQGGLIAFAPGVNRGSLRFIAQNNAGATNTEINNASFGQASVLTIPDPGTATASFALAPAALVNGNLVSASGTTGLVADAGVAAAALQLKANIKAVTTANIGGAGAGPITVSVSGMTSSSIVVATIASSSNTVSVAKAVAGTGGFNVTFSGDPGATCTLNYVAFIATQ